MAAAARSAPPPDPSNRLGRARNSVYATPRARSCRARTFGRHRVDGRCLEIGPAEGMMTESLVERYPDIAAELYVIAWN